MASLECNYCGYGIHYHGLPDGTQRYIIPFSTWKRHAVLNVPVIDILFDDAQDYFTAWKCKNCGCWHIFASDQTEVIRSYVPTELENVPLVTDESKYWLFDDCNFDAIVEEELDFEGLARSNYHYEFATVTDEFIHIFADKEFSQYLRSLRFFETQWSQSIVPYQRD